MNEYLRDKVNLEDSLSKVQYALSSEFAESGLMQAYLDENELAWSGNRRQDEAFSTCQDLTRGLGLDPASTMEEFEQKMRDKVTYERVRHADPLIKSLYSYVHLCVFPL